MGTGTRLIRLQLISSLHVAHSKITLQLQTCAVQPSEEELEELASRGTIHETFEWLQIKVEETQLCPLFCFRELNNSLTVCDE